MQHTRLLKNKFAAKKVLIAAHQGFSGGNIVLNSPNGMINAINYGADIVEIDISRTKDGKYYVFHQDLEPRHLMQTKKIDEMTSKKLDKLYFWNNSCVETNFHVSSLDEMMSILKTKDILINLDKCDTLGKELFEKLDEYKMEELFIVKGKCEKSFLDIVDKHECNYMFMPVVCSFKDLELALTYKNINIVGFEFVFDDLSLKHLNKEVMDDLKKQGYFLWVNAITLGKGFCLSAGMDDDISMLDNPDKGWGKLIDIGFNVIQTDWTPMLNDYIFKRGNSS